MSRSKSRPASARLAQLIPGRHAGKRGLSFAGGDWESDFGCVNVDNQLCVTCQPKPLVTSEVELDVAATFSWAQGQLHSSVLQHPLMSFPSRAPV